jgi:hypothetical protein
MAAGFIELRPGHALGMDVHDRALAIGNASLTGMRGRVARSVSEPVARRTRLSREEVQAILGFLLLAYTVYRLVGPLVRAAREQRA